MRLTRCSEQTLGEPLGEFYAAAARAEHGSETGAAMLRLVELLLAAPDERRVYALASSDRLCLLSRNAIRSPWFVVVTGDGAGGYQVQYLMPQRLAPWPNAYVGGEARSAPEAVRMILTAMDRSEGWLSFF